MAFQSTLPVGGATIEGTAIRVILGFQSTLPVGGATCLPLMLVEVSDNFNPRSPWGERPIFSASPLGTFLFQSTLPVGGATGGTVKRHEGCNISIHAPRGGSDIARYCNIFNELHFNPRSPWGSDPLRKLRSVPPLQFQSTLPVGGATARKNDVLIGTFISIHAPRGGSDPCVYSGGFQGYFISIHAPRGGSDHSAWMLLVEHKAFQSTLPVGGATRFSALPFRAYAFQSTLPVGGATACTMSVSVSTIISIHAPRRGERPSRPPASPTRSPFQSTLPVGGSDQAAHVVR